MSEVEGFGTEAKEPHRGRAQARMVLGPFAETKVPVPNPSREPRLQGRNPAYYNSQTDLSMKPAFVKEKANLHSR